AADAFTCALETAGTVRCWGHNDRGQLGDGTMVDRDTPAQVIVDGAPLANVTQISLGAGESACARTGDGVAWCWGIGVSGQLGQGEAIDSATPVQVLDAGGAPLAGV